MFSVKVSEASLSTAQAGGFGAVLKDVAQVGVAAGAHDFDAAHAESIVGLGGHIGCVLVVESLPAVPELNFASEVKRGRPQQTQEQMPCLR